MRLVVTDRDCFEDGIKRILPDKIFDLRTAFDRVNVHKDGSFAVSNLGYMLYGNGCNLRAASSNHPAGLVYDDGENIFGVGYFAKEGAINKHLHIIAPRGPSVQRAARRFIDAIRDAGLCPNSVYLRHLEPDQRLNFLEDGCDDIGTDPWHHLAPEEDETFPNRVFELDRILEPGPDSELVVKVLDGAQSKNHRTKGKQAHKRFRNFLEREDLGFTLDPYTYSETDRVIGESIVHNYFNARREQGTLVGSTPQDYWPLVHVEPSGQSERDYFAYVGNLVAGDNVVPIALFIAERLSSDTAGLYCTLTLRFPKFLEHCTSSTRGFTAIPQYVTLEVFKRLYAAGIRHVDIGGSETEGLDDHKRQLGGEARKTHWVVCPAANAPPTLSIADLDDLVVPTRMVGVR